MKLKTVFLLILILLALSMGIYKHIQQEKIDRYADCLKPEYAHYYEEIEQPVALCYWKMRATQEDIDKWHEENR